MKRTILISILILLVQFAQGQTTSNPIRWQIGSTNGQRLNFPGADSSNDGYGGLYVWRSSSVDSNDYNIVFRPYDIDPASPGRWVKDQTWYSDTVNTAAYTIRNNDFGKLLIFTYNGSRTITMPPASIVNSKLPIWIKDGSFTAATSGKQITINGGSALIDGQSSVNISTNGGVLGISVMPDKINFIVQ
jgi:hypothetical protein